MAAAVGASPPGPSCSRTLESERGTIWSETPADAAAAEDVFAAALPFAAFFYGGGAAAASAPPRATEAATSK